MPAGRPPTYKTAEELQERIDDYFENGVNKRKMIVGRGATKKVVEIPIPTITGLVLHCGFSDRSSFYDYGKKPEFTYTIKNARTRMESIYEEMMHSAPNPAGAIFALKNFGWKDKIELEEEGQLTIKVIRE